MPASGPGSDAEMHIVEIGSDEDSDEVIDKYRRLRRYKHMCLRVLALHLLSIADNRLKCLKTLNAFPKLSWSQQQHASQLRLRLLVGRFNGSASALQQRAILPITQGRDVIAQAQSGTGKPATFCISTLQSIDVTVRETQALVIRALTFLFPLSFFPWNRPRRASTHQAGNPHADSAPHPHIASHERPVPFDFDSESTTLLLTPNLARYAELEDEIDNMRGLLEDKVFVSAQNIRLVILIALQLQCHRSS
ncbi:hypothetical protein DFH09DRAFT_1313687 [Mycena vulgaris]|nr:hypothetical protein DFH09DRAFT_1323679 [Mycena vulgaris]KAJ6568223.1 hypothetical protein DFH09DRAFT_1313687 [Mycena vulgaris]